MHFNGKTVRDRKREGAKSSFKLSEKKIRTSGGDTIAYLREKAEKDFKLRKEVLKFRKEELELNKKREQLLLSQSGVMIQLMNKLAKKFYLRMEKADVRALLCNVWFCLYSNSNRDSVMFFEFTLEVFTQPVALSLKFRAQAVQ